MAIFDTDRDLIAGLSDETAASVLGLLDSGRPHGEAPTEFHAALAAAHRSPDVSRYILVNKARKHVEDRDQRGKGIE